MSDLRPTTFPDALSRLGINDPEATNTYKLAGTAPTQIVKHTTKREYMILGMTPNDFIKQHGSVQFDFKKLIAEFKKICLDYNEPLLLETPSKAVEFCSRILYEVGPESRQVRKKDGDKVWKFDFIYKTNDNKVMIKVAYVCTFKEDSSEYKPEATDTKIVLTVKHASLLAVLTLESINKIALAQTPRVYLLTPLAGAVFSKDDIPVIAGACKIPNLSAINIINASCQSGGQFLSNSRLHCAVIASIVATRNLKDEKMRDGIIGKTIKQYLNLKKEWKPDLFEVYGTYASAGVPTYLSPEKLIKAFDDLKKIVPTKAMRASKDTEMSSIIVAPATPKDQGISTKPGYSGSPPPSI